MLTFEEILFDITIYDDSYWERENNTYIDGSAGKLITIKDICQQFNFTEDEDQKKIGPTDPVDIGPKVSSSNRTLTQFQC